MDYIINKGEIMDPKALREKLLQFKKEYYVNGGTINDSTFDSLEAKLWEISPNDEYFDMVGYKIDTDGKTRLFRHREPMLSMAKVQNVSDIEPWFNNAMRVASSISKDPKLYIEPKIDGVSGSIHFEFGKVIRMVTRGDGKIGKIISKVDPYKMGTGFPQYKGKIEIRGEFYIDKKLASKYEGRPLRNVLVGLLEKGGCDEDISFIAYQIVPLSDNAPMMLHLASFYSVYEFMFPVKSMQDVQQVYNDYMEKYRDEWPFETDGLVVTSLSVKLDELLNKDRSVTKHNHYNMAIKPPAELGTGEIENIEWGVSRYGRIIPVFITSPIIIQNVEYRRCTSDNYNRFRDSIIKNKVRYGDIIVIKRSNDVIPKMVNIVPLDNNKNKYIEDITNCPSCGTRLIMDGEHKVCTNLECEGRVIDSILFFCKRLGMKGVGPAVVNKMYKVGVRRQIDVLSQDLGERLLNNNLLGPGEVKNVIKGINYVIENVDQLDIIASMSIVPGLGKRILIKSGIFSIKDLEKLLNVDATKYHINVERAVESIRYNKRILEDMYNISMVLKAKPYINETGKFKSFCVTGVFDKPRKEIINIMAKKGYRYSNSVNKNLDLLLVGDGGENSSKYKKATKLGTKMVREY